eukprot:scaffold71167_cov58-Phaeocystis_antarctica.AAC.4
MRAKFIGAARTVSTLVAVLPWMRAQGERGRGSGRGGTPTRVWRGGAVCSACRAMPRGTLAGVRVTAGFM